MTNDTTKKRIIKRNKQTNRQTNQKSRISSARPFCEWRMNAKIGNVSHSLRLTQQGRPHPEMTARRCSVCFIRDPDTTVISNQTETWHLSSFVSKKLTLLLCIAHRLIKVPSSGRLRKQPKPQEIVITPKSKPSHYCYY